MDIGEHSHKDERGAKADEAGEWGPIVAQLNREKREARRDADALRRQLQGAVDLIRELRGWADTYEDHMGPDDFTRRAEVFARADAFLGGRKCGI